jgi:2-haloacid dehalogenase
METGPERDMNGQRFEAITACVFDAYGTLFDISAIAERAKPALGERRAAQLIALWRQKQLEYTWLRSLMKRYVDFWHVTGDSLDYAMNALGIADPLLRSQLMDQYLTPQTFPEAVPVVRQLRAGGLRLGILSNGSPLMLTAACQFSGLDQLLHAVLSVEAAGVYKPHPNVYRLASEKFGAEPGAIAFVSSNAWDAVGAAAFGFRVAWVNRSGAQGERLATRPQAVLADLSGLPGLLGL